MQLDEALQVGGDIGKYLIGLLDIDENYKEKLIDLLDCFDQIQAKLPMDDDTKDRCQRKLVRTLAWLEIKLPLYWCTIVRCTLSRKWVHLVICGLQECSLWSAITGKSKGQ